METIGSVPDEFQFMAQVNGAIVLGRYEEALELFLAGLKHLSAQANDAHSDAFDYHISKPLTALLRSTLREHSTSVPREEEKHSKEPYCSFCGKSEDLVGLIGGPGVFICRDCVNLCRQIISETED